MTTNSHSKLMLESLARGFALFLGAFALLNVLGDLWRPGFDATLWWIDLRWLSVSSAKILLQVLRSDD